MDIRGKRFLVIGGAGLIGSHAVEELLKEDVKEVIIFDNFCRGTNANVRSALNDPRCKIFEAGGDILQTDILDSAMKDVDGVFHLAALWLLQCYEFPEAAFETNIRGTFNVLDACVKNKVQRLVYSSSASVYGDAIHEPMDEDHPYNNTNFYGATKIAGEHMCRSYFHRYKLPYVGLRYMNVYGPRQDYKGTYIAVIMKILDKLEQGERPVIYGDGMQAYDFVYVGDCGRANVRAMSATSVDQFYNVGTGIKTSIKELTEMLIEMTESNSAISYEPSGPTFVKNRVGCTKRAQADLGFDAKVGLRDGLKALIEWRRGHKIQSEGRLREIQL